jgi:guanine nucleotide-binding protein G(i) subunit alpha
MGEKLSKPGTKEINELSKVENIKIVLFGTGESGKTSVFKQLKKVYQDEPYTKEEIFDFRNSIYSNIFESTRILSRDCVSKNSKDPFDDPDNLKRSKIIIEMYQGRFQYGEVEKYTPEFHQMIGELWKENSLVEKFQTQSEDFHVFNNLKYFLDRFEKITPPDYLPSMDDIIHCRKKTIGMHSLNFSIENINLCIHDIGGSRNSRRMWIYCNFLNHLT